MSLLSEPHPASCLRFVRHTVEFLSNILEFSLTTYTPQAHRSHPRTVSTTSNTKHVSRRGRVPGRCGCRCEDGLSGFWDLHKPLVAFSNPCVLPDLRPVDRREPFASLLLHHVFSSRILCSILFLFFYIMRAIQPFL